MSTTPPEQPTPGTPPNVNLNLSALMPVPGNAELVVYVLATIVIGIFALAADQVNAGTFVAAFTVLTFAYLLSRGIAKASRVLER